MSIISNEILQTLLTPHPESPCVSMYMPVQRTGPEVRQNPIRFKNLLRSTEAHLKKTGIPEEEITALLAPAEGILEDELFWERRQEGLAVFLTKGFFHSLMLPRTIDEHIAVDGCFSIKPLLPYLSNDAAYFVLTLSRNETRLFRGSESSMEEVHVPSFPASFDSVLRLEPEAKQLQIHTTVPYRRGGGGGGMAAFHGHGSAGADEKDKLLHYFQEIDRLLHPILRDERAPLILAGVEYLFPLYREANTYQHLVIEGVGGNAQPSTPEQLHKEVWPAAKREIDKARERALSQYREMKDRARTATNLQEILMSAEYGRVEHLFVDPSQSQWGRYDPETKAVQMHTERKNGDVDLLEFAARQTLTNRGNIYPIQAGEIPDRSPIAAVFRY